MEQLTRAISLWQGIVAVVLMIGSVAYAVAKFEDRTAAVEKQMGEFTVILGEWAKWREKQTENISEIKTDVRWIRDQLGRREAGR
jgi:hypothetical protein